MAANTRIADITRILQGFPQLFPKASSAAATTQQNIGSVLQKSAASVGISVPSFSGPSSITTKYISYVLLGIVTFIALILFLQSIGVNIIQERSGGDGILPTPFKDPDLFILSDLYGTGADSININPTVYTINVPIFISSNISNYTQPVPVLLFYRSSATPDTAALSNTFGTGGGNGTGTGCSDATNPTPPTVERIDNYFKNGGVAATPPFQFAVSLDGETKDLYVGIYDNNKAKQNGATLSNPPMDVVFNLTIVVNNKYIEIYSNGKLTKSIVITNGIYNDSSAIFGISSDPNVTITASTVSIWNHALLANEISQIKIIPSNTAKKSEWSKFWKMF